MDRGAWQATVQWVTNSWTRLSNSHKHTQQDSVRLGTSWLVKQSEGIGGLLVKFASYLGALGGTKQL